MANIELVQEFFFDAMLRGYAGGAPKRDVLDMPGFREIEVKIGEFRLLDKYSRYLGNRLSTGGITIWRGDQVVWVMHYHGSYPKRVLPFLKSALRSAYEARQFVGGRGSKSFADMHLVYSNTPEIGSFEEFHGRENIYSADTERHDITGPQFVGSHRYHGRLLI